MSSRISKEKGPACRQAGQTLVELIVVITVSVLIVGALTFATISTIRNAQFARNQIQATKLAQEGVERLRSARDRNKVITISGTAINSWNDIWLYKFYENCGTSGYACYFHFSTTAPGCPNISDGCIEYIATSNKIPASAEPIDATTSSTNTVFLRAVILTDNSSTYTLEKVATAVVSWTDFSGTHESRISTVLRKL